MTELQTNYLYCLLVYFKLQTIINKQNVIYIYKPIFGFNRFQKTKKEIIQQYNNTASNTKSQ